MSNHAAPKPVVAYLTAGGAGMFCGSCMRDNTLATALTKLDCDPWLIPLYTPIRTDEENVAVDRIFFGGINVYLQQRFRFFRWLPGILDRWLDNSRLLKLVGQSSIEVKASELGELTLSMLRGEHGRQKKEVFRLAQWLKRDVRPELVVFSNILTMGCAPALKRELGKPVLATLQGDDLFLEDLIEPYKGTALAEVRRLARAVDGFIVFSEYYADFMADYLQAPRERFRIAPMGLATADLPPEGAADIRRGVAGGAPKVGYFARICPAKGFDRLIDAWLLLRRRPEFANVKLAAAGWLGGGDRAFFEAQRRKVEAAGATADFEYRGVLDRAQKFAFLTELDVFSAPTAYREPKGIYVLESLACGTPVVQPGHGAFPELVGKTGGGMLVAPHDTAALADGLAELLGDPARARRLGEEGRAKVRRDFTADRMAAKTLEIFKEFMPAR